MVPQVELFLQERLCACGRRNMSTPSFGSHPNPISTRGGGHTMPTLYWCPHQVLKATGAPCNTLLSFLRNRRYSEKATKLMSKLRGIFLCFFWTSQKTSNSLYLIFFHLYDFKLNFQDPNEFKKLTKVDVL